MQAIWWPRVALLVALPLGLGACASEDPSGPSATPSPTISPAVSPTQASPTPDSDVIDGSFDVGSYELYMRCTGTGSPTVVYLHGFVDDPGFAGHSSALGIQDLLDEDYRTCVYDRANVGLSDNVEGPLDGESSVADLRALLQAAGVDPPYVLLPASFGGLIADIFAATYPDEVVGMVQLDCSLPGDLEEIDKRFLRPEERPQHDEWMTSNEQLDPVATYEQARTLEGDLPVIPLTFLASPDLPPDPEMAAAVRSLQEKFVKHFKPGRLIRLDVPHYMEPAIPDRIAQEVRRVIEAAEKA
jgi:pimeloyl-ACP methyl ester carboxylesterase